MINLAWKSPLTVTTKARLPKTRAIPSLQPVGGGDSRDRRGL